jgi:hypothetical protein
MKKIIMVLLACASFASPAVAHDGTRVWIDVVNGKVVTLTSDNDLAPTIYTNSQLFTTELDDVFGVFTTEFPGYEVRRTGGSVSSETTFGFNITGPALFFDTATQTFVTTQAQFGPPQSGPVPQMALSIGSTISVTASGLVSGFNFFTFHQIGDHAHLSYTLLGDGETASDGPVGVYAVALQLTSNGLASSDTFYLLIGKGVADEDPEFQTAIAVAEATLVSQTVLGDMNCSGALDIADVPDFAQALLDPTGYTNTHQSCNILRGDMNQDGLVNGRDVQLFVSHLTN